MPDTITPNTPPPKGNFELRLDALERENQLLSRRIDQVLYLIGQQEATLRQEIAVAMMQ
jgi:hypothetical protein